jgi:DNA invertase Pin-like site-specific DNA recombinase
MYITRMAQPWLGYRRVSHVGGRSGERFHSPEDQAQAIRGWASARSEPVEMLAPELDESGGRADRPILLGAVERVERGDARGIVVAYQSRAGRNLRDLLTMWDRVEAAGGSVVSVRENIDTSTSSGRLMRNIYGSFDQHELDRHREDFERVRRNSVAVGIWQRRQTPRGYRRDDATRCLVPNHEADAVRQAFRARVDGEPISAIARRLGMTTSGARKMLANRVYLGELRVGDHVNPNAHEALVDEATFRAAQRPQPRPATSTNGPALLAGLARCAGCGHLVTRGGHAERQVYGCPVNHSEQRCPEPAVVTAKLLDDHVEAIAIAELQRLTVTAAEGRGVERARARVLAAERELAAFLEGVNAAGLPTESFADQARQRQEAVERARDELDAQLAMRPAIPVRGTGADAWERLNGHQRNALLRALLSAVVVKRAGGRGARTPLADRVRVLAHGAPIRLPERRGGEAMGIVPIPLPDPDDVGVIRVNGSKKLLKRPRRVDEVGTV